MKKVSWTIPSGFDFSLWGIFHEGGAGREPTSSTKETYSFLGTYPSEFKLGMRIKSSRFLDHDGWQSRDAKDDW